MCSGPLCTSSITENICDWRTHSVPDSGKRKPNFFPEGRSLVHRQSPPRVREVKITQHSEKRLYLHGQHDRDLRQGDPALQVARVCGVVTTRHERVFGGGESDGRNGRRRVWCVRAGLVETLQRDPLPSLRCSGKCVVHRRKSARIHASVHAERSLQNCSPPLLWRFDSYRPGGAITRCTGTLKHICAHLKGAKGESHGVPCRGPPKAPTSKRAGRSLCRISIRCASRDLSGATTLRSAASNSIIEPCTAAARRKASSGAH